MGAVVTRVKREMLYRHYLPVCSSFCVCVCVCGMVVVGSGGSGLHMGLGLGRRGRTTHHYACGRLRGFEQSEQVDNRLIA